MLMPELRSTDQRQEAVPFAHGAHDGIAFPVAGLLPQFKGFGASVDHGLTMQATAFFQPEGPFAAAVIVKPAHDTFWGGYAGYFQDLDGHLWETVWNPELLPRDEA